MALNPYQKNALEIEMRRLEQALLRARDFLRRPPEDSRLTRYRPISEAAHLGMEELIDQVLAEIAVLVDGFELQPQVEDPGSYLNAVMSQAWADLYDTLSLKLRRYGEVDPALAETLDPHIRRLIRLTYELGHAARQPAQES
jgi:hypothetical protein